MVSVETRAGSSYTGTIEAALIWPAFIWPTTLKLNWLSNC